MPLFDQEEVTPDLLSELCLTCAIAHFAKERTKHKLQKPKTQQTAFCVLLQLHEEVPNKYKLK